MNEDIALLAAVSSAIATAFAAFATWYAPRAAAKYAESLRHNAERADQRQRRKLEVFESLMQERGQIHSENGVRALNLIDIAFIESREVREAWSELFSAFQSKPVLQHVVDERLRKLLAAIAKDMGLGDKFRNDDFSRIYLPVYQVQERFIRDMQRQQIFASLQGQSAAGASVADPPNTPWPPKPD
jgi:hypothetical protein